MHQSFIKLFVLIVFAQLGSTGNAQPISASDYQQQLGIGFSTDWFKTSNLGKHYGHDNASLDQTITDLKSRGFSNLRLRSRADIWGFEDADPDNFIAASSIDQTAMDEYLNELDKVLDASLAQGLTPTISWIHHPAEGRANSDDGDNFVEWWAAVANRTMDRSHLLSFNLMTEVGRQDPDGDGDNGLYDDSVKWNDWTRRAITAIRDTGANNADRNIIIATPRNTKTDTLADIDADILLDDNILVEYHSYAGGASREGRNAWSGTGSPEDRARLTDRLDALEAFVNADGVPVSFYWGAWTPIDLGKATLDQEEIEAFAGFFAEELARREIPWSWNKLRSYYDSEENVWLETGEFGSTLPNPVTIDVEAVVASVMAGHERGTTVFDPADFDLDGDVDDDDLLAWTIGFGSSNAEAADGDANGDGTVDGQDFLLWQRGFGTEAGVIGVPLAVPEPTTCTTALIALLVSFSLIRKSRGFVSLTLYTN